MSKYSTNYTINNLQNLPFGTNIYNLLSPTSSNPNITLYFSSFKDSILTTGLLIGFILNYVLDTFMYNTIVDSAKNTLDNHISSPIFNMLTRPIGKNKYDVIRFLLYTSDDFIHYHI